MAQLATPEMAGYFNEQLAELRGRGHRNTVTDVRLEKGDLAESWHEAMHDYVTVAMRFSMLDATRDMRGYLIDGTPDERVSVSELWTFARPQGGSWGLSAIQQAA